MEKAVLLIPNVNDKTIGEDGEVYSLIYDLFCPVSCMDWNGELLALGHENGVSILTPIPSDNKYVLNLKYPFQQDWIFQVTNIVSKPVKLVKFTSKYLLTVHEDFSLKLLNHVKDVEIELAGNRHFDQVNCVDISENGFVASSSDDGELIVWDIASGKSDKFYVDGVVTRLLFFIDKDCDKLVVVENNNCIKVLDWKSGSWLSSIYPQPFNSNCNDVIKDVLIKDDKLLVIGETGWIKKFVLNSLANGCGFTECKEEAQLTSWINNGHLVKNNAKALIGVFGSSSNNSSSVFYNLSNSFSEFYQFNENELNLPSLEVCCGSINSNGIVGLVSGSKLLVLRPFDSYEVVVKQ